MPIKPPTKEDLALAYKMYGEGASMDAMQKALRTRWDRFKRIMKAAGLRMPSRLEALQTRRGQKRPGSGKLVWAARMKNNPIFKEYYLSNYGYLLYARGKNKGRRVHRVLMEKHIGRKLRTSEVVHHKDGDKTNNILSNLEVMTRSEHSRLHKSEEWRSGYRRR